LCLVADLLQTRNRLPQILPRDEQMIRRQVHPAPRGRSRELTISTASSRDRVQQLTLGEGGRIPPPQAEGAMLEVCDFIESYLGRDCAACDMLTMARAITTSVLMRYLWTVPSLRYTRRRRVSGMPRRM